VKKINDIIGIDVFDNNEGSKVFQIKNVVYFNNSIFAFIVNKRMFSKDCYIIKFHQVESFGKDLIVIRDKSVIQKVNINISKSKYIRENDDYIDYEVITKSGENLGFIKDIIFDENDGRIIGYIISDGIVDDILHGRKIIPNIKGMKHINNSIIVPDYIKNLIENSEEISKKKLE